HFESRARAALADAAAGNGSARRELIAQAQSDAKRVRRSGGAWGNGMADLLDGSIAALDGRAEAAVRPLRDAIANFDALEHALYAAVARCRLGAIIGGDEGAQLQAQGQRFMRDADVRAPQRLLHVFSPGFAP